MEYVVKTDSLTKRYGIKTVVNGVSLNIKKGEIYGLIGKNGAGKTTLMRILLGLTSADSGEAVLFGSADRAAVGKRVGALIEAPALYKNETAMENMRRFAIIAHTSEEGIKGLLHLVGLEDAGKKKVREFSLGMRQRLGIAIAMLGGPELMVLDEPINGLDPQGIKEIRDIILELNRRGVTFLISSHLLDELGKIATSYGIMANGVLKEEITAEELEERCRMSVTARVDDPERARALLEERIEGIRVAVGEGFVRVLSHVSDPSEISALLVGEGIRLYALSSESMGHEGYFIERMGK